MAQDGGMPTRLRSWFLGQWAPRIGDAAAQWHYRSTVWRVACLALLVVTIPLGLGLPGLTVIIGLVWVVGSVACLVQASRCRKAAQREAAAYLPFPCEPGAIRLRTVHEFDRWYVDMRRATKRAR